MNGQQLLNSTLRINAAFSLISGLDFVLFDKNIAAILSERDLGSLLPTGVSLIVFSIFVFAVSMMKKVNKYLVGIIILMDALWVFGSVFLLVVGAGSFTKIGLILIALIAAIIAVFAVLQILGLIRHLKIQTI